MPERKQIVFIQDNGIFKIYQNHLLVLEKFQLLKSY